MRSHPLRVLGSTPNKRGFTLIEALVASLIVSVSLMALVTLWRFGFDLTAKTDNLGVAYNIARHEMERVKLQGFDNAQDGATTTYYTAQGAAVMTAGAGTTYRFQATTTVTTYGAYSSYDATRSVTITVVSLLPTPVTLYHTGTELTKSGI